MRLKQFHHIHHSFNVIQDVTQLLAYFFYRYNIRVARIMNDVITTVVTVKLFLKEDTQGPSDNVTKTQFQNFPSN